MTEKIRRISGYLPEILIIVLCTAVLSFGIGQKKGYHQDELLSFELSNAEFNPWIVPTQPQGRLAKFVQEELRKDTLTEELSAIVDTAVDVIKNRGNSKLLSYRADVYPEPVWIDRQTFTDYITVDGKDDFDYLSVYFNVKDDNHPPLHFMVLHTISSLFQGKIAPWMGCVINLIFVILIMILMMQISRSCMSALGCPEYGRIAGDTAALLYGLSAAALSTTLLIRMYAMLTFFCVILLKLHVDKYVEGKFGEKNKGLILVTVLGFWTQYFFLFYCMTLAAVTMILLLRKKRTGEFLRYLISMITAAVIGLVGFPFAIGDVFSSGRGTEALENLASGLSGYGDRLLSFGSILCRECGVIVILYFVLICLVWGIAGKKKKEEHEKAILAMMILPVAAYFLLAARMSPYLVNRYIMPLFPMVFLCGSVWGIAALARCLCEKTKHLPGIIVAIAGAMAVLQPFMPLHSDNPYYYKEYAMQEQVADAHSMLSCICVYDGVRYYENLPEFTRYEKTLLLTEEELSGRQDRASIEELSEVVVLIKEKARAEEIEACMESYGFAAGELLYDSNEQDGDRVILFRK